MDRDKYIYLREKMIMEKRKSFYEQLYKSPGPEQVRDLVAKITKCNKILFDLQLEARSLKKCNPNTIEE